MSFRFNRTPRGLLGLLDAKVGGQTPQEIAAEVRAVVDAFPLFHAQIREAMTGQTAGNVTAGVNLFTGGTLIGPPADELWWVEHFSVKCDTSVGAGNTVCIAPMINSAISGSLVGAPIVLNSVRLLANQVGWLAAAAADRAFLMVPGDTLGTWVETVGGLLTFVTGCAHVARIKI
jgi:hypothetical protein